MMDTLMSHKHTVTAREDTTEKELLRGEGSLLGIRSKMERMLT